MAKNNKCDKQMPNGFSTQKNGNKYETEQHNPWDSLLKFQQMAVSLIAIFQGKSPFETKLVHFWITIK